MSEENTKPTLEKIWVNGNEVEEDRDEVDDVLPALSEKRRQQPLAPPPSAITEHPTTTTATTTFGNRPRHNTRVDAAPISTPGRGFVSPPHTAAAKDRVPNEEELSNAFTRELEEGMKRLVETNGNKPNIDPMNDEVATQQKQKKQVEAV